MMRCYPSPVPITHLADERIRFIAAGSNHSIAISTKFQGGVSESKLYSGGLSDQGQLGLAKIKNKYNVTLPEEVEFINGANNSEQDPPKIVFASAASNHTLCVDSQS